MPIAEFIGGKRFQLALVGVNHEHFELLNRLANSRLVFGLGQTIRGDYTAKSDEREGESFHVAIGKGCLTGKD
ncbi:hypothetical protein GCM10027190_28650 [Spirosoma areae]